MPSKIDTFFETLKTLQNQVEVFDKFHVWTRLGELESQPTRVFNVSRHGQVQYAVPACDIKKIKSHQKYLLNRKKALPFQIILLQFWHKLVPEVCDQKYHMSLKRLFVRFHE